MYVPLPRLGLYWPSRSGEPKGKLWLVCDIFPLSTTSPAQCRCQVVIPSIIRWCEATPQLNMHRADVLYLCTQHPLIVPVTKPSTTVFILYLHSLSETDVLLISLYIIKVHRLWLLFMKTNVIDTRQRWKTQVILISIIVVYAIESILACRPNFG